MQNGIFGAVTRQISRSRNAQFRCEPEARCFASKSEPVQLAVKHSLRKSYRLVTSISIPSKLPPAFCKILTKRKPFLNYTRWHIGDDTPPTDAFCWLSASSATQAQAICRLRFDNMLTEFIQESDRYRIFQLIMISA
jgi:hypothetical protein